MMGRRVRHGQKKKSHEGTQHVPEGPEIDAERMRMPWLKNQKPTTLLSG